MTKAAKRRAPRSESTGRQTPRRTTSASQPLSNTGLETIGENEPGAPDALDLVETVRPMSPHAAKSLDLATPQRSSWSD